MKDYEVTEREPTNPKLKYIPTIGDQYGSWTVISDKIYKRSNNRQTYWKVRCECGKETTRGAKHLVEGKSSGCWSCSHVRSTPLEIYFNSNIKNRPYSVEVDLTYLRNLIEDQDYNCALSGVDIHLPRRNKNKYNRGGYDTTASLDRIDNEKGYVEGNLHWVHKDINMMKGKLELDRFIKLCEMVSSKCG